MIWSDVREDVGGIFPPRCFNSGGQYRSTGVDVEATSDAGGGSDVGWLSAGEWLQYTVNVGTAGTYDVTFRVASATTGGSG